MKIHRLDRRYLSHRDQLKVRILEDECLMLSQTIARVVKKRDRLMRKRDKILDKGLEA